MHLPSSSSSQLRGESNAPRQDEGSCPAVNSAGAASKLTCHDDEDDDIVTAEGAEIEGLTSDDSESDSDSDIDSDASDSDGSDCEARARQGQVASMLVKNSQYGSHWGRNVVPGHPEDTSSRQSSVQGVESGDDDMTDTGGGATLEKLTSANEDSHLSRLSDVAMAYSDLDPDSGSNSDPSDDSSEDGSDNNDRAPIESSPSNFDPSASSASDSDEYDDDSEEEPVPGLYAPSQPQPHVPQPVSATHHGTVVIMEAPVATDWTGENGTLADVDFEEMMLPAVLQSNPNPSIPGSENVGLVDFLRLWAYQGGGSPVQRSPAPYLGHILSEAEKQVTEVRYSDLNGDKCDFQALDWTAMETTRRAARSRRYRTYKNYVNHEGSDVPISNLDTENLPLHESFFRFRRMHIRRDVRLAHFQLRSVLACPSRTHAYYPTQSGVCRINTISGDTAMAMNTSAFPAMGGPLSALDADCGVVMGGTFSGEYFFKSLDCEDANKFCEGQITSDFSNITNHVKIYQPQRLAGPLAAVASNDCGFRIMHLETERFISETMYPFALNCSAMSPDQRLRVVVGDCSTVLITNSDTGEVLQKLSGHRDYGFSCDWSEDGRTVATGFQDRAIKIWDARKWCNSSGVSTPMFTVRSEMASARGLRFSPLGSGRPVLVAAEEADFVNLIDAQTLDAKQTIDVFGEIGGVSFANDGQDLNILCCDTHRGGLLQLERCGRGPEPVLGHSRSSQPTSSRWTSTLELTSAVQQTERGRRPGFLEEMEPF